MALEIMSRYEQIPSEFKVVMNATHLGLYDVYTALANGYAEEIIEWLDDPMQPENTLEMFNLFLTGLNTAMQTIPSISQTVSNAEYFYRVNLSSFNNMMRYRRDGTFNPPWDARRGNKTIRQLLDSKFARSRISEAGRLMTNWNRRGRLELTFALDFYKAYYQNDKCPYVVPNAVHYLSPTSIKPEWDSEKLRKNVLNGLNYNDHVQLMKDLGRVVQSGSTFVMMQSNCKVTRHIYGSMAEDFGFKNLFQITPFGSMLHNRPPENVIITGIPNV